jgi:hypothetical protein
MHRNTANSFSRALTVMRTPPRGGGVRMIRERADLNFRSRSMSIRTEPSLRTVSSKHTLIRSFSQILLCKEKENNYVYETLRR